MPPEADFLRGVEREDMVSSGAGDDAEVDGTEAEGDGGTLYGVQR